MKVRIDHPPSELGHDSGYDGGQDHAGQSKTEFSMDGNDPAGLSY
jgi:hypothetical protein